MIQNHSLAIWHRAEGGGTPAGRASCGASHLTGLGRTGFELVRSPAQPVSSRVQG